jgi:hypothetical protein
MGELLNCQICQLVTGKDVNTEAKESAVLKAIARQRLVKTEKT